MFAKQKKCLPDKTSVGQTKRVFAKLFAFLPKSLRNSLANRLISPNYLANCLLVFSGVHAQVHEHDAAPVHNVVVPAVEDIDVRVAVARVDSFTPEKKSRQFAK